LYELSGRYMINSSTSYSHLRAYRSLHGGSQVIRHAWCTTKAAEFTEICKLGRKTILSSNTHLRVVIAFYAVLSFYTGMESFPDC